MALTPTMTVTIVNGEINITDTTVYGGANSARNQVTVSFTVNRVLSGNQEVAISLPAYDPSTVASIVVGDLKDGRHVVTMTIDDPITASEPSTSTTVFRFNDLESEWESSLSAFQCDCCGNGVDHVLKVKMALDGITTFIADNNFLDAQCVLEGVQTLINDAC